VGQGKRSLLLFCKMNQKEFQRIFEHYFQDVVSFLYTYTSDRETLNDWVQEVFIKIWGKKDKLDIHHPGFKGYILTTARNHALEQLKRQKKYETWLEENIARQKKESPFQSSGSESSNFMEQYRIAVKKLPERAREAYLLSREDGLKYKEIASVMDISVKTVEAHMSKALELLRDELDEFSRTG